MKHFSDIFPAGWRDLIGQNQKTGLGLDLATTEKQTSNPAALAIVQDISVDVFAVRLVMRWKTSNDLVTTGILDHAFAGLPKGLRPRALSIDATNERFYAGTLRRRYASICPVHLVINSEAIEYQGERMTYKSYLGNLLVNVLSDNALLLPKEEWLYKDLRSVKRDKGTFSCDVDENGNHGDCFDAIKLALHSLISAGSGPVEASAAGVGAFSSGQSSYANRMVF